MFDLTKKIALITGASRGLGWSMAQSLAKAGAHVVLNARDEKLLKERIASLNIGVFHSGLSFVARDRQAAYFSDPAGAQILLCTEIGSEGRNFEFAHHLVLFDLPLYPDLLEQRIGRLDRIGQTSGQG